MAKRIISREALQTAYNIMTVQKAAKKFGVSVVTFYELLDRAGIKRKKPRTQYEIVD